MCMTLTSPVLACYKGKFSHWYAWSTWRPHRRCLRASYCGISPSQGVSWERIDGSSARATLTDGDTTVSLVFHFNADGEITSNFADSRPREVNGELHPTPWAGNYADYAERDGMRIPMRGEVAWHLENQRLPYWRGRVLEATYEYAQPVRSQ